MTAIPPSPALPLLILGASVRAAARSAARAGFAPIGVDLFADRDLAALGPASRVAPDDYPRGLADVAERLPPSPWIYTGAIENHPDLIDRIASTRPLLGIGGPALRSVRDPRIWAPVLRDAGLCVPETLVGGDHPPRAGAWLLKPVASAAGRGIRAWSGAGPIPRDRVLQRRIRGVSLGATFLGDGATARLVGTARAIRGPAGSGREFGYRGSVGPWPISGRVEARIRELGVTLAGAFSLKGLFGVDLVLRGETPWPVEINPRYTGSMEILEEALGLSLIDEHARRFGIELPGRGPAPRRRPAFVAKRILFARRAGFAPGAWTWTDPGCPRPIVADIPAAGAAFEAGDPVLTILSRGPDLPGVLARLRGRAARWRRRIDGWSA